MTSSSKRRLAIFLALMLTAVLVLVAATSGLGKPGLPGDDVALVDGVDDGAISQEDLDAALEQAAAQAGLPKLPPEDDPQYESLVQQAMQSLILAEWVKGEAADRGITVTQEDIDAELERIKEQSFSSEKEFEQFVKQSKFSDEDIQEQVELTLLRDQLEQEVISKPTVTDDEIEDFYEANIDSFTQPASRDVRVILNSSQAKAEAAKQELEADDSEASWAKVAKKYSQDQATKDRGGLLEGLTQGQGDPQLEEEAFAAAEGEIVGPFETDRGWYVLEVTAINPESTQPLSEAQAAIEQQLVAAGQQQIAAEFQSDFTDKWTPRTICAPAATVDLCDNYVAPEPAATPGQPAPPAVLSRKPIEPGASTISIDGAPQQGLPQGPQPPPVEDASGAGQLPPGSIPLGPNGAPAPTAPPTAPTP
ncbi:MAG TPA: peptidyl-prolyl cis-trans isomerase [Solirubrobacterales bacterium]|nr:peptidyl-prolyl cis-trans isomerase [Solirubrobacterales bacterium]